MISSRLYYASMMLFWVCYLSMLALVVIYAPQGGVATWPGLHCLPTPV
jgi:hypothetical protein